MNRLRQRLPLLAAGAALALACFWLGRTTTPNALTVAEQPSAAARLDDASRSRGLPQQAVSLASNDALVAKIRAAVRAELGDAAEPTTPREVDDDTEEAESAEMIEAATPERAHALVDAAVDNGSLDFDGQRELDSALDQLGRADQAAVLSRLHMAINAQQVDLERP